MTAIEKGIPMPLNKIQKWDFFKEMEIGDSVFYPLESTKSYLYMNAQSMASHYGIKISGRTQNGGLRIWRVE